MFICLSRRYALPDRASYPPASPGTVPAPCGLKQYRSSPGPRPRRAGGKKLLHPVGLAPFAASQQQEGMALEYARKEYTASVLVKATGREYRRLVIQLSKRRENFRLIFRLLSDRPGHIDRYQDGRVMGLLRRCRGIANSVDLRHCIRGVPLYRWSCGGMMTNLREAE